MITIENFYAVLGNPIAHSKSPQIHRYFALETGITLVYKPICIALNSFEYEVRNLIIQGLLGANVTLPFKEDAWKLCDTLSEEAEAAGAVNTLAICSGEIFGHNTDGLGLVSDLKHRHGLNLTDAKILILGAGGAARGIIKPLLNEHPDRIVISNRTFEKAQILTDKFKNIGQIEALPLSALTGTFDLIINATSSSLTGQIPDLPDGIISANTCGYDLMYGPEPTAFMTHICNRGGKMAFDGLGMLVEQAALSFQLWHGVCPQTDSAYHLLRTAQILD